ncbi:MAG: restriction endonuclease subunit S [Verrucomicrobiae bacterium]
MIANLQPYPEYKELALPWLGRLPSHWGLRRNGGLFLQRNETDFPDLPILEVAIKSGVKVRDLENGARKQVMTDRRKYKRALCGDIAYNMMRMWQGATGRVPVDGLVSPAYVVARPLSGTESRYFELLFRTPTYQSEVNNASRGIVSDRNRLYWPDFKQLFSPLPPPEEQSAIVRFLDYANGRLERAIRSKRKVIALLHEQKQAIIHRAVTCGLDPTVPLKPSGIPWLGDIPKHWELWRISRFARIGNGSTPSRGKPTYWSGGTYPWLNSSQVNRGFINSADQFVTQTALRECHLPKVPTGSVLVAITGQGKTRGMSAVLGMEATINQHIAFITPRVPVASAEFIHLALSAAYLQFRASSEDSGSTKGAITCEDLKRFKIAIPPTPEQEALVSHIQTETHTLNIAITRLDREISLLREYRTRLVADVVTGKLDVRPAAASCRRRVGNCPTGQTSRTSPTRRKGLTSPMGRTGLTSLACVTKCCWSNLTP